MSERAEIYDITTGKRLMTDGEKLEARVQRSHLVTRVIMARVAFKAAAEELEKLERQVEKIDRDLGELPEERGLAE